MAVFIKVHSLGAAIEAKDLATVRAMTELSVEQRIWQVVHAIPEGCVCTYGEVAKLAGLGRGARLVGRTLGKLPEGSKLPWHRVINAKGELSFDAHSERYQEQQRRLQQEGVVFVGRKIRLKDFLWRG